MHSDPFFNVDIQKIQLVDTPASIYTLYKIGGVNFSSSIQYTSLASWNEVRSKLSSQRFNYLIGLIVAFDSFRFLTLGGEAVILPKSYPLPKFVKKYWNDLFRNVYGEWRHLNDIQYPSKYFPKLVCSTGPELPPELTRILPDKLLITNGGGKDTLYNMLRLRRENRTFDIYQAYLPFGGEISVQKKLLNRLSTVFEKNIGKKNEVYIYDDFTHLTPDYPNYPNPDIKYPVIDFFVGHTANYVGLFPLAIANDYTEILFNIEDTSDRVMLTWNHCEQDNIQLEEPLNHQFCKSTYFRQKIKTVIDKTLGLKAGYFKGFNSSLKGMTDTFIFQEIAKMNAEYLIYSHSCNIIKPWCKKCLKCCFSYLMTVAYMDMDLANRVFDLKPEDVNLFDDPSNQENWNMLLKDSKVAWECVAPTSECVHALKLVHEKGHAFHIK